MILVLVVGSSGSMHFSRGVSIPMAPEKRTTSTMDTTVPILVTRGPKQASTKKNTHRIPYSTHNRMVVGYCGHTVIFLAVQNETILQ